MISVIVITRNRALLLKKCVESLLSQDYKGRFEVIVVDNGSEEGALGAFDRGVKITRTERVSLSKCRSLGVDAAQGSIIAFTDDDCVVSKGWLSAVSDACSRSEAACGPVMPREGTRFPSWWKSSMNWMAGINPGPSKKFPALGSNIAFRKETLRKIFSALPPGLKDTRELSPYREDYYLMRHAAAMGISLRTESKMLVYHNVPSHKLTVSYLLRRSCQEAGARLAYEHNPKDLAVTLLAIPAGIVGLVLSLDLNRFFRIAQDLSYISKYLKKCLEIILR